MATPGSDAPLSAPEHARLQRRPASGAAADALTRSLFVAGGEREPSVDVQVIRREGRPAAYEIRLDIRGVRLGTRASAPPLEGRPCEPGSVTARPEELDALLAPFAPEHLEVAPRPERLRRPHRRVLVPPVDERRYNTTVFGRDDRQVFEDTSYPWSALGRCETNIGPFSGAMVGPRHLLTCNHGIDWTAPPGFAADWLTFVPAYFDGDGPFGSTWSTHVYWMRQDDNNGLSEGEEGQFDYVVLVLADRIGERTGWLGSRRYTDAWDDEAVWWHIGYPSDLTSMERPTYQSWFALDGDDDQDDAHQEIRHQADVFPGQSGGPMFGFWEGEVGPRAVAVQSWQSASDNGASGGGDLVDLVVTARREHP